MITVAELIQCLQQVDQKKPVLIVLYTREGEAEFEPRVRERTDEVVMEIQN